MMMSARFPGNGMVANRVPVYAEALFGRKAVTYYESIPTVENHQLQFPCVRDREIFDRVLDPAKSVYDPETNAVKLSLKKEFINSMYRPAGIGKLTLSDSEKDFFEKMQVESCWERKKKYTVSRMNGEAAYVYNCYDKENVLKVVGYHDEEDRVKVGKEVQISLKLKDITCVPKLRYYGYGCVPATQQQRSYNGFKEKYALLMVFERIPGKKLSACIDSNEVRCPVLKLDILEKLIRGLQQIHEAKVVHTDLHSSNVMVTIVDKNDGHQRLDKLSLIDFGASTDLTSMKDEDAERNRRIGYEAAMKLFEEMSKGVSENTATGKTRDLYTSMKNGDPVQALEIIENMKETEVVEEANGRKDEPSQSSSQSDQTSSEEEQQQEQDEQDDETGSCGWPGCCMSCFTGSTLIYY